jgi:hypothetical protein
MPGHEERPTDQRGTTDQGQAATAHPHATGNQPQWLCKLVAALRAESRVGGSVPTHLTAGEAEGTHRVAHDLENLCTGVRGAIVGAHGRAAPTNGALNGATPTNGALNGARGRALTQLVVRQRTFTIRSAGTPFVSRATCAKDSESMASPARMATSSP